jgi:hypothetical protein
MGATSAALDGADFGSNAEAALKLNLGAGSNPMGGGGGFAINVDMEAPALAGMPPMSDFVLADATNLPFREGVFDEVHAVNPYGYNPVNPSVASVMADDGSLAVTGGNKNKYAKNSGSAHAEPSDVGLEHLSTGPMRDEHAFGDMRATAGHALDPTKNSTRTYGKAGPAEEGDPPAPSPAQDIMALAQMAAREDGYMDEWADADDLRALGYMSDADFGALSGKR